MGKIQKMNAKEIINTKKKDNKYSLIKVKYLEDWDDFVKASSQGTIFSLSKYLKASGVNYDLYYVCKGTQVMAGVCLTLSEDKKKCIQDDLIIHNGIMFLDYQFPKEPRAKIEKFKITEFILENLLYNNLCMSLAPSFEDMRPFLWYNYPKETFKLDLRYTSYLDLTKDLLKNTIKIRRTQIKDGEKSKAKLVVNEDVDSFMGLYKKMEFSTQENCERVRKLITKLLEEGMAELVFLKEKHGHYSYGIVWGLDNKRAYALFAAGTSEVDYKGTYTYHLSFDFLKKSGAYKEIDFEGVNSPQRGFFKLSLGGDLRSYYKVIKNEV